MTNVSSSAAGIARSSSLQRWYCHCAPSAWTLTISVYGLSQCASVCRSHARHASAGKQPLTKHIQKLMITAPPSGNFATSTTGRSETSDLFIARAAAGATATTSQSLSSVEINPIINTQVHSVQSCQHVSLRGAGDICMYTAIRGLVTHNACNNAAARASASSCRFGTLC